MHLRYFIIDRDQINWHIHIYSHKSLTISNRASLWHKSLRLILVIVICERKGIASNVEPVISRNNEQFPCLFWFIPWSLCFGQHDAGTWENGEFQHFKCRHRGWGDVIASFGRKVHVRSSHWGWRRNGTRGIRETELLFMLFVTTRNCTPPTLTSN